MDVQGIDHVEFYAADADSTADRLRAAYGFRTVGRLGPEPAGQRSILLRQRNIQVLVTTGAPGHPAADYVARHGDGVATVALSTSDPAAALVAALDHGAVPLPPAPPTGWGDGTDAVRVRAFGSVGHSFVRPGALAARFAADAAADAGAGAHPGPLMLLDVLDHVAACVPAGQLEPTVQAYREIFGFERIYTERIEVGNQAMNSEVVQSRSGTVTVTLLEPDPLRQPGQIDDFLAAHGGAGVQHLALRTDDIATAVRTLSGRGVGFLETPGGYYDELERLSGAPGLPLAVLRELGVLVDRDESGELFQIFSRSTHPRRTFFFEVIERRQARTFGSSNIKALYRAVERDRARAELGQRPADVGLLHPGEPGDVPRADSGVALEPGLGRAATQPDRPTAAVADAAG